MVYLLEKLSSGYSELLRWGDPRVTHLPLMGSPIPALTILLAYLFFVFEIGPDFMKKRKPYDLRRCIMVYNVIQIILNSVGVVIILRRLPEVNVFCTPLGKPDLTFTHYLYFLVKTLDLGDTVFFVLRKKYGHISILHLYHHIIMFVGTWITCNYIPGGQLYFLGSLNCFVHVMTYFYYFLTSWDSAYKNSLWWKRHLTELQIIQHCLVLLTFVAALLNSNCTYPKAILLIYLPGNFLMIYLFVNFYIKTYTRSIPPKESRNN